MLPYLVLVCLTAVTSATLQALGRFALPAFAPAVLNVCWIVGAVAIAPRLASDAASQAYILAACVLVGGVLQWIVQWPALRREGFRLRRGVKTNAPHPGPLPEGEGDIRRQLRRVRRGMIPTMLAWR